MGRQSFVWDPQRMGRQSFEACFCSMYYWELSPVTLRFNYGGHSGMVKNEDGFLCHVELLVSFQ
ncbi:hypothetical protein Tco_0997247, partial [Tanacetum coccineum]